MSPPFLQAKHCLLRPLNAADAPSIARHANDERVWRNLFEGFPHPYTLEDAKFWCTEGSHDLSLFGFVWGIEIDREIVGCLGVRPETEASDSCNAEVGYWLGHAYWGKGIAVDALITATQWAFSELTQIERLFAPIYSRNAASQRVAQKAGYTLEARIPRSKLKAGEVLDVMQYAHYRSMPAA